MSPVSSPVATGTVSERFKSLKGLGCDDSTATAMGILLGCYTRTGIIVISKRRPILRAPSVMEQFRVKAVLSMYDAEVRPVRKHQRKTGESVVGAKFGSN